MADEMIFQPVFIIYAILDNEMLPLFTCVTVILDLVDGPLSVTETGNANVTR